MSQDIDDSSGIDPEEIYHNDFHLYFLALRRLALEPDAQCHAEGDYNVAQELQYEIIVGRCLIGKGKLSAVEEKAVGELAAAADALPKDALLFANGHTPNVEVMRNLAWAPLRVAAATLILLLEPRAAENCAYFGEHKLRPNPRLERTAPGQPARLFKWFAKAHAYVFYALRSTAKSAWNDGLEDWKALVIMSLAMGLASLAFVCIVSISIQHRVFLPSAKPPFVALWSMVMIGFLVFNHYSLVFENKWSRFKGGFQHQSAATRTIGFIFVWVSVVLIVLAAEWAGSIAIELPAT